MLWTALGAIGAAAGGAASAGGFLSDVFGDDPDVPIPPGYKTWVQNVPDMTSMIQGSMPMSYAAGVPYPSYGGSYRQDEGQMFGGMEGAYPATQNIYKSFLGGNYGMSPERLASTRQGLLASQNLQGLEGRTTPASVAGLGRMNPQRLAQSLGQYQDVAYQDKRSYLMNAARLANYNQNRAHFLGGLLGSVGKTV